MKPNETNDEARVLCARTCLECCCQEHHWGDYGGADDANGEADDCDDNTMQCKHCPARLDYTEKCTLCGKELIDHDTDTFSCDFDATEDADPKFTYAGQPKRECKQIHPWDQGPTPDEEIGNDEAAAQEERRHTQPVIGCECRDCLSWRG